MLLPPMDWKWPTAPGVDCKDYTTPASEAGRRLWAVTREAITSWQVRGGGAGRRLEAITSKARSTGKCVRLFGRRPPIPH